MKLREFVLSIFFASALVGVGGDAHAQSWLSSDKGVIYEPYLDPLPAISSAFELSLISGMIGYTGLTVTYPDFGSIKSWEEKIDISLLNTPTRGDWISSQGATWNSTSSRCGRSIFGFSCAEAATGSGPNVGSVPSVHGQAISNNARSLSGPPVRELFGGRHEDRTYRGPGSGIGSVTLAPEPKIFVMMLAGIGLMGFVAQRRQQGATV